MSPAAGAAVGRGKKMRGNAKLHEFIANFSAPQMAALFCGGFVAVTVVGVFALRPYARRWIHGRRNANDMIGFSLQSFATLYGILLALLAVEAYQDYSAARDAVSRKALAFTTLYHDAVGLPAPLRETFRHDLRDYASEALATHWSDTRDAAADGPSPTLRRMLAASLAFQPATKSEELVQDEVFRQINVMIEQRRLLLESAREGIPDALWSVVWLGAAINILLMCLFDMETQVHVLLAAATSLFLGAVVFLVAALDNPFRGGVTIDPAPIIRVRDRIAQEPG
jgi:hypothetical protein